MAKVNYPASSPYSATPQSPWYIGHYTHRTVPASDGDRTIVVGSRHQHRPDMLSNDLYGSPAYWWVFCARNRNIIKDPIWDLVAGIEIVVPSADAIARFGR